jgi:hypothetical protein
MTTNQTAIGGAEIVDARTAGFGVSYAVTSILSAIIVILKESSEGFHDKLAAITGHHWVSHGLLDIIVFFVLGFILTRMGGGLRMSSTALIGTVVGATVLSGLVIAGYFV